MSNFTLLFEKHYPWVGGIIVALIFINLNVDDIIANKFDNVLNGAITFSSIVVGFLGALLAILVSIKDTNIMKYIYGNTAKYLLMVYFKSTIVAGLLVVILSIILYFIKPKWLIISWCFLLIFFILSSYRIIDILLKVIFKTNEKGVTVEDNRLSESEAIEIRNKYSSQVSDNKIEKGHKLSNKRYKN